MDDRRMLTLGLLIGVLSGCATIIHGTTQQVRFESSPAGATATVGSQTLTTPGELKLSRANTYDVTIEKPGYIPAHEHIGQESSGAIWGNLLLGGLVGIIVDSSNGAAYDLTPATISTVLVADPSVANPPAPSAQSDTAPAAAH